MTELLQRTSSLPEMLAAPEWPAAPERPAAPAQAAYGPGAAPRNAIPVLTPAACGRPPLVFIQPSLAEYRVGFYATIAERWPGEVVVVHGRDRPGVVATDTRPGPYRRVEVDWKETPLGMQLDWPAMRLVIETAAVVVVPGDPRLVIAHRLLMTRRCGGRCPVVAWSQFRGADAGWLTSLVKPWWHRAFDGLILYTQREAEHYLALGHASDRLTWLDNGLSRLPPPPIPAELKARRAVGPLVCLGRLFAKNRFDLAIQGFIAYRKSGGRRRLLIIGDGPENSSLRALAKESGDTIEFAGAVYDPVSLDRLLRSAVAVLHPLAMGLSINTAFGYGLPVIACDNPRRHMPEFWVFREGHTGVGFPAPRGRERDSIIGIADALLRCDALSDADYTAMALAAYAAIVPLTTTAMAERVMGLCRSILDRRA